VANEKALSCLGCMLFSFIKKLAFGLIKLTVILVGVVS
jgi:hypothetical protein